MKKFIYILLICVLLASCLFLIACDPKPESAIPTLSVNFMENADTKIAEMTLRNGDKYIDNMPMALVDYYAALANNHKCINITWTSADGAIFDLNTLNNTITEDRSINLFASSTTDTHTVTFVIDNIAKEQSVNCGSTPQLPELPIIVGKTAVWDKELHAAYQDTTYTAIYSTDTYTVGFIVDNVTHNQLFDYNDIVELPDNLKPALGYKATSDRDFARVTENTTYNITYSIDVLDLPIVNIETNNRLPILDKENYVPCKVTISNTEFGMEEISAGIRGRGNTTWSFDKKPYRIKFDKKQSMFGSGYKAKSWTLIANYLDKSLLRNSLGLALSREMNGIQFTSSSTMVDFYLNGSFCGTYIVCDQIEVGDGRIDLTETNDPTTSEYLIEMDTNIKWEFNDRTCFILEERYYEVKFPKDDEESWTPEHLIYAKEFISMILETLKTNDYSQISKVIDINSAIDYLIVNDITNNLDCRNKSAYFQIKGQGQDRKLYFGPVWDFDWTAFCDSNSAFFPSLGESHFIFKYLLTHEPFIILLSNKFEIITNSILPKVLTNISLEYFSAAKSIHRNFEKWKMSEILKAEPNPSTDDFTTSEEHMNYLINLIKSRTNYLKGHYITLSSPLLNLN